MQEKHTRLPHIVRFTMGQLHRLIRKTYCSRIETFPETTQALGALLNIPFLKDTFWLQNIIDSVVLAPLYNKRFSHIVAIVIHIVMP